MALMTISIKCTLYDLSLMSWLTRTPMAILRNPWTQLSMWPRRLSIMASASLHAQIRSTPPTLPSVNISETIENRASTYSGFSISWGAPYWTKLSKAGSMSSRYNSAPDLKVE